MADKTLLEVGGLNTAAKFQVVDEDGTMSLRFNGLEIIEVDTPATTLDFHSGTYNFNGTTSGPASLNLYEDADNGLHNISFKAPSSLAASYDLVLPTAQGAAADIPFNDGSGNLSWVPSHSRSVKEFGAVGDGVTDDTSAINDAFAWLRTQKNSTYGSIPAGLHFPRGVYLCLDSINATDLRFHGWKVTGEGSVIHSHATGKAAMDLFYTMFGRIEDLTIYGDPTNTPAAGFAIGRDENPNSCAKIFMENCKTRGNFSVGGLYNFASEECTFHHCKFYNYDTSSTSYAAVFDGTYKVPVPSDFRTMPVGESARSFTLTTALSSQFYKVNNGPAVYLRRTHGLRFYHCYVVTEDDACVVMDADGSGFRGVHLDCHFESAATASESDGALSTVRIQGSTAEPIFKSFTLIDQNMHARREFVDIDTAGTYGSAITSCTFRNSYIGVDSHWYSNPALPTNGIFSGASVVDFQGKIYLGEDEEAHKALSREMSKLELANKDNAAYGTGTQTITADDEDFISIKGEYRFYRAPDEDPVAAGELNDQGSVAINGRDGVQFYADNSGGTNTKFASIDNNVLDATDTTEDGELVVSTIQGGSLASGSITVGAGAPAHTPGQNVGIYLQTDGTDEESLHVWDGGNWTSVKSDVVKDTSPQLGGSLDANSNTITGVTSITFDGQADALNYYDEGSWTPVLRGTSAAGSQTYTTQAGQYTRIGRLVFCSANLVISAVDGATSGNIEITGLPFTAANDSAHRASIDIGYATGISHADTLSGRIVQNNDYIRLQEITNAGGTNSITDGDLGAAVTLNFSFTYYV